MDTRRGFLEKLGKFAFGASLANEGLSQDKSGNQKESNRDRYYRMRDVGDQAVKFDKVEAQQYKEYIKAPRGSQKEIEIFDNLKSNYRELESRLMKLLEYSADEDSAVSEKALSLWSEINKNITARKKECSNAGKEYFDSIPAPKNPKPPKE